MSSPVTSSSVFSSMSARPPTPPRDVSTDVDDALRFLEEGHQEPDVDASSTKLKSSSTDTPPPRSSPTSSQLRGSTAVKKVDFSPHPTYHSQTAHTGSPRPHFPRQLSLIRAAKPLKSILKPSNELLPLTPDDLESKISVFSPQVPGSFRAMLQSIIRLLEGSSRDGRRDAYLALNGALRTYDGVPEPQAIVEKIQLLMQFMTRDMAWKDSTGKLDSHMVTQSLQLACALLHNVEVAEALDDDFRAFIIDRSIFVLEQPEMPKSIVKSHLFILCQQRYNLSTLNASRVDKLVTALQTVETRCSGNTAIAGRLIIFQRLIEKAPSTMLNRMRDWIEHMFHGMMSSVKDVRARAIEACAQASLSLGTNQQATKILHEICEKEMEDGRSYGDFVNLRLMQMCGDKELASLVPRIWSAVIMFFRCKRKPIDKWPKFRSWLLTLQKCLNSGDMAVKHQANMAWNKLVFSVMPDSSTTETMRSMLTVPIVVGLEKRGNDKTAQYLRQFALDSYCNLLHYALRPALSHEELDPAWDLYVGPILTKMIKAGSRGQLNACRVLHGLLQSRTGVWNINAAMEPDAITPANLPRLDPRWIRSRLGKIIKVLEPMIIAGMWSPAQSNELVDDTWRLMLQAVTEAGSQEVKASNELKEAIAQLVNFFRRIWNSTTKDQQNMEDFVWVARYRLLLESAVTSIGVGHFGDDILSRTSADELEAAPTPSHRSSKHAVSAHAPFAFLYALYYQPPIAFQMGPFYDDFVAWFLHLFSTAKSSSASTLGLLHRSMRFCAALQRVGASDRVASIVWQGVADRAIAVLDNPPASCTSHDTSVLGLTLRTSLNILSDGLALTDATSDCLARARELLEAACRSAKHHAGNGGVALGVMEPLAKSLIQTLDDLPVPTLLHIAAGLLDHGVWPHSRQELETSRKVLWVVSLEPSKNSSLDPFDCVYKAVDRILARAYREAGTASGASSKLWDDALTALTKFLRRCPTQILSSALSNVKNGLSVWIADAQRLVYPITGAASNAAAAHRVDRLWSEVALLLKSMPKQDSALLKAVDQLMVSALSSPSKVIVNNSILFWNSSFGNGTALEYPPNLVAVLRARSLQADLSLPGLPQEQADSEVASLPVFAESQSASVPTSRFEFSPAPRSTPRLIRNQSPENFLIKQHLAVHGLPYDAAAVLGGSSTRSTPAKAKAAPKLRHDDSQIQFAPIDSSPVSYNSEESQVLTEHQKEVKERQRGDAQMFPGMSSSPAMKSSAARKNIAKKLNFTSGLPHAENENNEGTPTGPADANPMSDDLPSSPTPRATAVVDANAQVDDDDEDAYDTDCDPPSSPPRDDDSRPRVQTRVVEQVEAVEEEGDNEISGHADSASETSAAVLGSDLPSDTALPADQLRREAAAAVDETTVVESSPEKATEEASEPARSFESPKNTPPTPSRIEDSMIQRSEDNTPDVVSASTPQSHGESKKRKRSAEKASSAKKQKQSPFKSFWTGLLSRNQEADNDDDIEDEIVVASSQVVRSPQPSPEKKTKPYSPQVVVTMNRQSSANKKGPEDAQPSQSKRTKKARKAESKESSKTVEAESVSGVKRRASAMSSGSVDEPVDSSISRVEETPAPGKSRKKRKSKAGRQSQGEASALRTRSSDSQSQSQPVQQPDEDSDHEAASPEKQLTQEHSAAVRSKKVVQPASILGRLRGVLADCKKMIIGKPEDEREFDDVLYEIRKEIFEAERRGRDT
ncbi:unnamed protein product [Zymoseptoria tritici ST99CH_1A5]|nr:unnamed protein product [Zymoseptoria tritici ST99CH_1E4]SMY23552.1 unnamed protein product [Zymoseptoria tritici ST99CH_1A5]